MLAALLLGGLASAQPAKKLSLLYLIVDDLRPELEPFCADCPTRTAGTP